MTFALNRRRLETCLAVSDDDVRTAMAVAFAHFKLVVEPGGAVALAAVLSGRVPCRDRAVVVVASGGNVDRETFADALDGADWTVPPPRRRLRRNRYRPGSGFRALYRL